MKVRDIVAECLKQIDESEYIAKNHQAAIDRIVFNVNVVCREIATNYLKIIEKQKIKVQDGEFVFADLHRVGMLYPVKLEIDGKNVDYKVYATRLKCEYRTGYYNYTGDGELSYACLPSKEYGIEDDIPDDRLTMSVMTNGVLAEYYFQTGDYSKAKHYDIDYRRELGILKYADTLKTTSR